MVEDSKKLKDDINQPEQTLQLIQTYTAMSYALWLGFNERSNTGLFIVYENIKSINGKVVKKIYDETNFRLEKQFFEDKNFSFKSIDEELKYLILAKYDLCRDRENFTNKNLYSLKENILSLSLTSSINSEPLSIDKEKLDLNIQKYAWLHYYTYKLKQDSESAKQKMAANAPGYIESIWKISPYQSSKPENFEFASKELKPRWYLALTFYIYALKLKG